MNGGITKVYAVPFRNRMCTTVVSWRYRGGERKVKVIGG